MASTIRSLIIRVGVDMTAAQKNMKRLGSDLQRAGRQMQTTGRSLTRGLTLPLAAAGFAALKFGADFETSLAKVDTIADTSVKSLGMLKTEVLSLSDVTGVAGTEINEALYQAISAGVDTVVAMELVEVAVKSAKAGFTDTTTAVDGLTSVLNAYNMETKDGARLANLFLVTQNKGKTTFGALADSIGNVAPIAQVAGVSIEELLSGIASLTIQGIDTATAITGIRTALTNIIKPSEEASTLAEQLGLDFSSSALKSKGFVDFLEDVQEKTGGNVDMMAKLFGNVRGLNAMLSLTSDVGMSKMNETLDEMETNTTALDEAYAKVTDTLGEQFKIAINELKNVAISLGDVLMPIIKDTVIPAIHSFSDSMKELLAWFGKLSKAGKGIVGIGLAIAMGIGPALIALGKMSVGIGAVVKGVAFAKAAMAAGNGFSGALTALLGPVGLATVALAGIVAVVGGLSIIFNNATKETRSYQEEASKLADSIASMKEAHQDNNKEIEQERITTGEAIDKLIGFNNTVVKSTLQQTNLKIAVDDLNSKFAGLNLSIDESTGLLNLDEAAIRAVTDAMFDDITIEAARANLVEIRQKQLDVEQQMKVAVEELAKATGRTVEEILALDAAGLAFFSIDPATAPLGQAVVTLRENAYDLGEQYTDTSRVASEAIDNMVKKADELAKKTAISYDLTTEQMQAMVDTIVLGSGSVTAATKLTKDEFTALTEQIAQSMGLTVEQTDEMFSMYNSTFDTATADYEQYIRDLESATNRHYSSMGTMFKAVEVSAKANKEDLLQVLQDQVTGFKDWDSDLDDIAGRSTDKGKAIVDDGLIAELKLLGPKAATEIEALATMSDEELVKYVELWREKNKLAAEAAEEELNVIIPAVEDTMTDIKNVLKQTSDIEDEAVEVGEQIANGMRRGMVNRSSSLYSTARSIASRVLREMKNELDEHSESKEGIKIGEDLTLGFTGGILNKAKTALTAASSVAKNSLAQFNGLSANGFNPSFASLSPALSAGNMSLKQDDIYQAMSRAIQDNQSQQKMEARFDINGREFARATVNDMDEALQDKTNNHMRGLGNATV